MSQIDPRELRNACGRFATGITIVSTEIDGEIHGMTANGFMSVSLEPPLILVSVGKNARSHDLIAKSKSYGVSILTDAQQPFSNHFAGRPDENLDIPWETLDGNPVIAGTLAQLSAKVVDAHEAGDHTLYIAEVTALNYTEGQPVLYYYTGYGEMKSG